MPALARAPRPAAKVVSAQPLPAPFRFASRAFARAWLSEFLNISNPLNRAHAAADLLSQTGN
jgi:hypothetical protein